jgi:hypothetical protein
MQDKGLDYKKSKNKQGHLLTSLIVFRLKINRDVDHGRIGSVILLFI